MDFNRFADLVGIDTAAYIMGFNLAVKPEHILGYLEVLHTDLYGPLSELVPDPDSPLYQKWKRRSLELDRAHHYDETDLQEALKHVKYILENWNK